jgi:cytidylate kinase
MTLTKKLIIAIDGPAASGKGSLAKKLAKHLDFDFLDTGALYRRVALKVIQKNIKIDDIPAIIDVTKDLNAELGKKYDDSALRNDKIGSIASIIAQIPEIRQELISFQHNFAKNSKNGAVLDGRDIGTVICPDANVKLFITASVEERSKRRYKELHLRGIDAKTSSVLAEMQERDERDSNRLNEHLKPDHDCHVIDTSDMTPKQVMDAALRIVDSVLK